MTTETESIMKKIKKLLTLANCKGATEAEAKQAMELAQLLMTKYKISSANIEGEKQTSEIKHEHFHKRRSSSINPADEYIMWILQRFYRVRVLYSGGRFGKEIVLIGTPEDIEIAKYVHGFLRNIFFKCWKEYKHINPYADRRSYYRGLADGLEEKMTEGESKAKCEAKQESGENACKGYELVKVNTEKAIANYVNETWGDRLKQGRNTRRMINGSSYNAGKTKGGTISINKGIKNE